MGSRLDGRSRVSTRWACPRHITKVSSLTSLMYLDLKSLGEARVSLSDIQRTGFLYVSLRMGLVKGFCDCSL